MHSCTKQLLFFPALVLLAGSNLLSRRPSLHRSRQTGRHQWVCQKGLGLAEARGAALHALEIMHTSAGFPRTTSLSAPWKIFQNQKKFSAKSEGGTIATSDSTELESSPSSPLCHHRCAKKKANISTRAKNHETSIAKPFRA